MCIRDRLKLYFFPFRRSIKQNSYSYWKNKTVCKVPKNKKRWIRYLRSGTSNRPQTVEKPRLSRRQNSASDSAIGVTGAYGSWREHSLFRVKCVPAIFVDQLTCMGTVYDSPLTPVAYQVRMYIHTQHTCYEILRTRRYIFIIRCIYIYQVLRSI